MAYEVTFIPGDGTGPELAEATRRVLEATGVAFRLGCSAGGNRRVREVRQSLSRGHARLAQADARSVSKGPTTTPVGSGFRSVNVLLRKELDLYACMRP